MNEFVVKAQKRTETGKNAVKKLRTAGLVPGICYGGHNNETPVMFTTDRKEFSKILRTNADNFIISLDIDGAIEKTMVRDFQVNHLTDLLLHIDLQRVSMSEKVEVEVHVELTGDPVGVKQDGGVLQHALRVIHVRCLTSDIPARFTLDVSALKMGDALRVSDLPIDASKVEVMSDGVIVIASVAHGISEDAMNVQLDNDTTQPEVIGQVDDAEGDGVKKG